MESTSVTGLIQKEMAVDLEDKLRGMSSVYLSYVLDMNQSNEILTCCTFSGRLDRM